MSEKSIKLFEEKTIRTHWDADEEKWYFSIVDVIEVLTEQRTYNGARKYWSVMKTRMKNEGAELTTFCSQLKLIASDSKMRLTDVADTEQTGKPAVSSLNARSIKELSDNNSLEEI